MKTRAPWKVCTRFSGIRLAGRAVRFARVFMASDEKSRQTLLIPCGHYAKFVTPFALGRPCILLPCGRHGGLTFKHALALTSGRFTPCGAQRCGLRSYHLCAPLTPGLPPRPRTPGGTRFHAPSSEVDTKCLPRGKGAFWTALARVIAQPRSVVPPLLVRA